MHAGKNHAIAGAISGLAISWRSSPINMIGTAALVAAASAMLSQTELERGPEQSAHANSSGSEYLEKGTQACCASAGQKASTWDGPLASVTQRPKQRPSVQRRKDTVESTGGLLEQAAWHVHMPQQQLDKQVNVALAAAVLWDALQPGCRTCAGTRNTRHGRCAL
jgi:hypothetical protein